MSEARQLVEFEGGEFERWFMMECAPRDGTKIAIVVKGNSNGYLFHEFPYPVIWHEERWCFARTKAPLFLWQQPKAWRPWRGA